MMSSMKGFVVEFGQLLHRQINPDIFRLEYAAVEGGNEFVYIHYADGHTEIVDVTGCGRIAVMENISRVLKGA